MQYLIDFYDDKELFSWIDDWITFYIKFNGKKYNKEDKKYLYECSNIPKIDSLKDAIYIISSFLKISTKHEYIRNILYKIINKGLTDDNVIKIANEIYKEFFYYYIDNNLNRFTRIFKQELFCYKPLSKFNSSIDLNKWIEKLIINWITNIEYFETKNINEKIFLDNFTFPYFECDSSNEDMIDAITSFMKISYICNDFEYLIKDIINKEGLIYNLEKRINELYKSVFLYHFKNNISKYNCLYKKYYMES